MSRAATAFAPAKINLALHVTGQREDGYHLLDSLVVFADMGDSVTVQPAPGLSLSVTGPFARGIPASRDNLVWRAAELMGQGAEIRLDKRLPPAAGIGGGSSDAAATLLALREATGAELPGPADVLSLGADVPACLLGRPCRMSGIGEAVEPVEGLPPMHFVLVNPRAPLRTPDVFAALAGKDNRPMPPSLPGWGDAAALADWLKAQRNDLEMPARGLAPAIGVALSLLGAMPGCLLARMSGSGATCFGLFASRPEAEAAARELGRARPDWWIAPAGDFRRA